LPIAISVKVWYNTNVGRGSKPTAEGGTTMYETTVYYSNGAEHTVYKDSERSAIQEAQRAMSKGAIGAVVHKDGKELFIDYKG
jgi:hypothetical protein